MKKRYWLRGGVMGFFVWVMIFILTLIISRLPIWGNAPIDYIILGPIYFPGVLLFGYDGMYDLGFIFHPSTLFTVAVYFFIGSLIGWSYGKSKSKIII